MSVWNNNTGPKTCMLIHLYFFATDMSRCKICFFKGLNFQVSWIAFAKSTGSDVQYPRFCMDNCQDQIVIKCLHDNQIKAVILLKGSEWVD